MTNKVTVSSSSKDLHGDTHSLDMLTKGVETINGTTKMRMLINHRRDLPPIGYWDNAELDEHNSVYLLKAEQIFYSKRETITDKPGLIKESFDKSIAFIQRPFEDNQPLTLTIDKNNFKSWDEVKSITETIINETEQPVEVNHDVRKDLIPDPRLIVTLTTYYSVIYPLIKPFLKKMGEKIAEDIADDIYEKSKTKIKGFLTDIKKQITTVRKKALPQNKKLITIFEIPGKPYIELHAITDNADLIIKSLNEKKIFKIHQQLNELSEMVNITEAHFKLNEKGNWKFTYLITEDGAIIGTKDIMAKRDYLHQRINLRPIKGFSIGADVKYSEYEELP